MTHKNSVPFLKSKTSVKIHFQIIFILIGMFITDNIFAVKFVSSKKYQKIINLDENAEPKIAVCYWGLTRSTSMVYQSHFENFFNVLREHHISYDVFMHTWETKKKQRVWENEVTTPINYEEYKLLNPTFFRRDDQDDFTNNLDFNKYYYVGHEEWEPNLVLNHLCALESLKRVTDMVLTSKRAYDFVIYIRPDVLLQNKLIVSDFISIKKNDIVIPDFHHWSGYNDRFAILRYESAPIYGNRIDGIVDFRQTQGCILSERYLKYTCMKNALNVILINFYFVRVRPDGTVR